MAAGSLKLARVVPRALPLLAACAAWLFPALAQACPVCAGRADAGPWRGVVLGIFIFFPFAVVYAVIRFIKSEMRRDADDSKSSGAPAR